MLYKTIVLELIQSRPSYHNRLCQPRMLLPTLNQLAQELKDNHLAWQKTLSEADPQSDPQQIASEALERALQELRERLPSESTASEDGPLTLDAAIAFLRPPTPTE